MARIKIRKSASAAPEVIDVGVLCPRVQRRTCIDRVGPGVTAKEGQPLAQPFFQLQPKAMIISVESHVLGLDTRKTWEGQPALHTTWGWSHVVGVVKSKQVFSPRA